METMNVPHFSSAWRCGGCGEVEAVPVRPFRACSECGAHAWRAVNVYACATCVHAELMPAAETGIACGIARGMDCRPYSPEPRLYRARPATAAPVVVDQEAIAP